MEKVSIIIVNYNTFELTSNCIRSVIDFTSEVDYEIILVDNASTECDPGKFLERFPSIILIKSTENSGFAKGNNLGIEQATGDYIILLNSDTIFREDAASMAVRKIHSRPQTGVLGCRMVFPNGKVQYTARRFRTVSWELLDLFRFIPLMMPYNKRAARMLGKYFRHDEDMACDWVNGAFFLFPKKILDELPGKKLDDRFFMYGEDQLWCEQIKARGYEVYFYVGTTIIHINSGSTAISGQLKLRRTMRKHELEIMRERKGEGLYYQVFKMIFITKEASRNLVKFIYYKLTGRLIR